MLELARDVAAATDGDELLMRAATRAAELVGATTAAVAVMCPGPRRGIRARRTASGWQHEPARFPGEHSILQRVLATGSPYICNDTAADPHADQEAARRLGIRNCLCVPLRSNDGTVSGSLFLTNKLGRAPFNEQDLRLALAFADLAAAALHKTEALATARQDVAIAEALLRALAPVQNGVTNDVLIERTLQETTAALQADAAVLAVLDSEGTLRPLAVYPAAPSAPPLPPTPLGQGIIGRVAATGEPFLGDGSMPETDRSAATDPSSGYRSQMAVPIRAGDGRLVGVIAVQRADERPFTRRQLRWLHVVADRLGHAPPLRTSSAAPQGSAPSMP